MHLKKNHILLVIKLAVITAAFALIIHKADTTQITHYLTSTNPLAVFAAYFLLVIAQTASALRMKYYFKSQGLQLNNKFAIGLYFTGMFFNTILPGGIGGDGYKVYLLGKLANFPKLKSVRLLLSDRASGLFILMILGFLFAFFSNIATTIPHAELLLTIGIIITIISYFICIKILLKEKPQTAIGAAPYSVIVQISSVMIVLAIIWGLGTDISNISEASSYITLFLISSILAVLPISIGGVGIRELSFMYGANLLNLDPELGIAIAIIFFVINLICSLNGLFFWHKLEKLYN